MLLKQFSYDNISVPEYVWQNSGREVNREYLDKLVQKVFFSMFRRCFFSSVIRETIVVCKAVRYLWEGICTLAGGRMEVSVLDAAAVTASLLRGDFKTAGSVMFLLGIGEILEEWTHKKSIGDLARSMSLNVSSVWLSENGRYPSMAW